MRKVSWQVPKHILNIVEVVAWLATYDSHASFFGEYGRSRYRHLTLKRRPSGVSFATDGPIAKILKGSVQFKDNFSFRAVSFVS